jgi:hypothetical protein
LRVIVLVGIEAANPLGAETLTTKLDELQPETMLDTPTPYVSCWPGKPHDPRDAHANVLAIEALGAFCVHPAAEPTPGSLAPIAVGASTSAKRRPAVNRGWATRRRRVIVDGFLSVVRTRREFDQRADSWSRR